MSSEDGFQPSCSTSHWHGGTENVVQNNLVQNNLVQGKRRLGKGFSQSEKEVTKHKKRDSAESQPLLTLNLILWKTRCKDMKNSCTLYPFSCFFPQYTTFIDINQAENILTASFYDFQSLNNLKIEQVNFANSKLIRTFAQEWNEETSLRGIPAAVTAGILIFLTSLANRIIKIYQLWLTCHKKATTKWWPSYNAWKAWSARRHQQL